MDLTVGGTLQPGGQVWPRPATCKSSPWTTSAPGAPGYSMQIGRWSVLGAYALWNGQLAVGGGARILTLQVNQSGGGTLLTMTGLSPEDEAALLMPMQGTPWRLGATVPRASLGEHLLDRATRRSQRTAPGPQARSCSPSQIVMPWEVEFGAAYQLGPRPLNPGFQDPSEQESVRTAAHESSSSTDGGEAERERLHRVQEGHALRELAAREDLLLASVLSHGAEARMRSRWKGLPATSGSTVGRALSATPWFGLEGSRCGIGRSCGWVRMEPSRWPTGGRRGSTSRSAGTRVSSRSRRGFFRTRGEAVDGPGHHASTNGGLGLSLAPSPIPRPWRQAHRPSARDRPHSWRYWAASLRAARRGAQLTPTWKCFVDVGGCRAS